MRVQAVSAVVAAVESAALLVSRVRDSGVVRRILEQATSGEFLVLVVGILELISSLVMVVRVFSQQCSLSL